LENKKLAIFYHRAMYKHPGDQRRKYQHIIRMVAIWEM